MPANAPPSFPRTPAVMPANPLPSFPRTREPIPGMVRHHDPASSPSRLPCRPGGGSGLTAANVVVDPGRTVPRHTLPPFPRTHPRHSREPPAVIPANAGIYPRHGAPSRPPKQSVTPALPTRWWIWADRSQRRTPCAYGTAPHPTVMPANAPPSFPRTPCRHAREPPAVIPANAGIYPRHGAPSRPRKQSVTPALPTRWWIWADARRRSGPRSDGTASHLPSCPRKRVSGGAPSHRLRTAAPSRALARGLVPPHNSLPKFHESLRQKALTKSERRFYTFDS